MGESNIGVKRRRNPKKGKDSKKLNRLLKIFVVITILVLGIIGSINLLYSYFNNNESQKNENSNNNSLDTSENNTNKDDIDLNIAVFGVDKDKTRTDVIFVVHFDSELNKLSMLSIPRDTKVDVAPEVKKIYEKNDYYYKTPTKINSIHSYGGKKGVECSILQIEDFLGVDIDYYVKFDMQAVVEFVDAFGGVDFYVPQDMYWDMRDTGDILINLKEGMQHIDGKEALQLLRYRYGYAQQDIDRIQTQQDFINALFDKIANTDEIMKNLPNILKTIFKYVETDIGLNEMIKYSKYIGDIKDGKIIMETIPGVSEKYNGIAYYIPDEEGKKIVINKIFYDIIPEYEEEDVSQSSKELNIEISNGGITNGMAGKKQEMLEELGYNVAAISTYNGEKKNNTRIVVKSEGIGEDLIDYFENAEIIVDDTLIGNEYDIKIILGLDEK